MFVRSLISLLVLFLILFCNTVAAATQYAIWGYMNNYYVSCNTTTRNCVGTLNYAKRTMFEKRNVKNGFQQFKVVGKYLCLNVWWGGDDVNLFECTDPTKTEIKSWELFNDELITNSDRGRVLYWPGEGKQMRTKSKCYCFDKDNVFTKDECAWSLFEY